MRSLLALASLTLLVLPGCGERAPGIIVTDDGRMMDNSAENNRAEAIRTIEHDLQAHLGEHWRVSAALPELPRWNDERAEGEWQWSKATVTVSLLGDGQAPLPIPAEEIREGVTKYMRTKVERPKANLTVEVTQAADAAAFASAVSAPPAAAVPKASGGQRSYVVQAGDTLADISSVFYGSPQHWRLIAGANPGLDPGHLEPGRVLVIPPATGGGTEH